MIASEKRKHMHGFIRHISLLSQGAYYLIFSSYISPMLFFLHFYKKKYFTVISSPIPTPRLTLFPVTPTQM